VSVSIEARFGTLEGCSFTGGMDVGDCRNGASVSEEAQYGGLLGRATLFGTPKDMLGLCFLKPQDIKNLSLGAIWSFGKVTGLP
jgi:hypothetical protein